MHNKACEFRNSENIKIIVFFRVWRKVNFKRILTVLNLEFTFSYTGCHTKFKESVYPTIYQ